MSDQEFQWIRRGDGELVLYQHGQICTDRDTIKAQRAEREQKQQIELARPSLISGA